MKFSIITPTIQRESLVRCCESVLHQTFSDWEMLVQVDAERIDESLFARIPPTRKIWVMECGVHHNNFGNTCRHMAWERITGDWVIYLDCDNFLVDDRILEDITQLLADVKEQWALFPIRRHGSYFFNDPPGNCQTDTANMVIRREVAQWPDGPEYTMDGLFCEQLKAKYPYAAFPNFRPIVIMEESRQGK